ncbi:unnamed protein product [Rhodiola kirilowii]
MGKDDRPLDEVVAKGGAPPHMVIGHRWLSLSPPPLLPFLHLAPPHSSTKSRWPPLLPPHVAISSLDFFLQSKCNTCSHLLLLPWLYKEELLLLQTTPPLIFTSLSRSCNICNVVILALEIKDSSLGASTVVSNS